LADEALAAGGVVRDVRAAVRRGPAREGGCGWGLVEWLGAHRSSLPVEHRIQNAIPQVAKKTATDKKKSPRTK
jgi:hypothetical protein